MCVIIILMKKDNEMPSLDDLDASMDQEDGADMECGGSETVQMAQVSCCMTFQKMETEENEQPSMVGDDEIVDDEEVVLGKRMEDMVKTHDEAAEMCTAEGTGWTLCLVDDLMSGQIYFQETMEEEMTAATAYGATESYGVWVRDQCEPFSMEMVHDIIEYEAVGMAAEFDASNESSTVVIDSDSMLIGAGIGAVVMLLVVGLFSVIMKWRKTTAKGQDIKVEDAVLRMEDDHAPNVVPVDDDDDSAEVAKADGTATVDAVSATQQ